jgi:hypothetical protein
MIRASESEMELHHICCFVRYYFVIYFGNAMISHHIPLPRAVIAAS